MARQQSRPPQDRSADEMRDNQEKSEHSKKQQHSENSYTAPFWDKKAKHRFDKKNVQYEHEVHRAADPISRPSNLLDRSRHFIIIGPMRCTPCEGPRLCHPSLSKVDLLQKFKVPLLAFGSSGPFLLPGFRPPPRQGAR